MNVLKLLPAVLPLILASSLTHAKELDEISLTQGILALQCSDEKQEETLLFFVQKDAEWSLNDADELIVTDIRDGFRLTRKDEANFMGFVTEDRNGDWTARFTSPQESSMLNCTNIHYLVDTLAKTIGPRLDGNYSETMTNVEKTIPDLEAKIDEQAKTILNLEQGIRKLTSRETFLTDKLLDINQQRLSCEEELRSECKAN